VDLIGAKPNPDGCQLDEEIVGSEFVITGCGASALLDLVENRSTNYEPDTDIGAGPEAYARYELFSVRPRSGHSPPQLECHKWVESGHSIKPPAKDFLNFYGVERRGF
jgi:hypothetical protein